MVLLKTDCSLKEVTKQRKMVVAVRDFPSGCGIKEAERKALKVSEFGRNKSSGSRTTGKVKYWDPTSTNGGINQKPKVTTTITKKPQVKPLKNLNESDSNISKISKVTSVCNDKLAKSPPVENIKPKTFEPKELVRNKSYLAPKSTAKVKYWDPICANEAQVERQEIGCREDETQRKRIKEAMVLFEQVHVQLNNENLLKPMDERIQTAKLPTEVAKVVKKRLKWVVPEKKLGSVCGVGIGDRFKYRAHLEMIGLHCQPQAGIDYGNFHGKKLAISVVDSHRYSNESMESDTLVYSGQGGTDGCKVPIPQEDQKLEKGNLALMNSWYWKTPVRVIRKLTGRGKDEVFAYYGLYRVSHCARKRNEEGAMVFNFHMDRIPGQPPLDKMMDGMR